VVDQPGFEPARYLNI